MTYKDLLDDLKPIENIVLREGQLYIIKTLHGSDGTTIISLAIYEMDEDAPNDCYFSLTNTDDIIEVSEVVGCYEIVGCYEEYDDGI